MPGTENVKKLGEQIFTVPNALTLLRLLIIPVVIVLLLVQADGPAVALFIIAALTDFLDGKIARRTRPTQFGAIIDPIADRLMLSSTAIVLAYRGVLPVWAVGILVGRDLFALLGSLVFGGKVRVNRVGKAATAMLMVAVALAIFRPGLPAEILFYGGIGLSLVAGLLYLFKISRISGTGGALL